MSVIGVISTYDKTFFNYNFVIDDILFCKTYVVNL